LDHQMILTTQLRRITWRLLLIRQLALTSFQLARPVYLVSVSDKLRAPLNGTIRIFLLTPLSMAPASTWTSSASVWSAPHTLPLSACWILSLVLPSPAAFKLEATAQAQANVQLTPPRKRQHLPYCSTFHFRKRRQRIVHSFRYSTRS
jgi:hypothetical protein